MTIIRQQRTGETVETKGEVRRRQVIAAASECFRREGFHGSSIARIAKVAGMSTGHIYHYFPTKELIVSAIVEEEEGELAALIRSLEREPGHGDFLSAVSRQIDRMIDRSLEPDRRSLMLEIAAEAARNPTVAAILQQSDARMAARFAEMARHLPSDDLAGADDGAELSARLEILPVLFAGLALRSVQTGRMDRPRMARLIRTIIANTWRTRP